MNVEAYKVSVRIALEDQITRGMAAMGADILNLDEKVKVLEQSLKHLTTTARSAQKALKNIAVGAGDPFTAAKQNADDYAKKLDDIQERSRAASKAISERPVGIPPAVLGGALLISNNAIAERAASASSHGGGRGGGGGLSIIPSHAGGPGYDPLHGWQNGVPPGGWGSGGAGGGSGGGNKGGGGRPEFSHSDAFANLAIGYGGFKLLGGFVDEAAKYQTITEKFKQYGMGDAALKEAEKFSSAQKIFGVSNTEMLANFTEVQGVYRESGMHGLKEQLYAAKIISPLMAQLDFASQALDEHQRAATTAKKMDMVRFLETAGATKSPERAKELINGAFKAIQASGGNIDFTQYRQFMAKAKTSAYGMSDMAIFAEMEPIIGEMKGSSAGDAYMTAYNRAHGILTPTHQAAKEWLKLGLWNPKNVSFNSQGRLNISGDPLIDKKTFEHSQVEFYMNDVLPKYRALHYTEEQIRRTNAILFGRTGGGMYNLIDKQLPMILSGMQAYPGFRGVDDATKSLKNTYNGKVIDFDAKWKNFELALGQDGGLLDLATKGLNLLADSLDRVTKFAKRHPELTKLSVEAIAAISGLAMLSGGIFVLGHAASTLLKTFQLLRWTMELLAGKKELQLAKALTGVSDNALLATRALTVLTRWLGIIGLFVPTNNTPNTTQEMASIGSIGQDNLTNNRARWVKEHPGVPFPPELRQSQFIRPNPTQPIHVTTHTHLDGRPIAKTVTKIQAQEAQRSARSTQSTYDPTMTPPTVALGR